MAEEEKKPKNLCGGGPDKKIGIDAFHIATQQQYGPPPTQTGIQGPTIKAAMAPTSPLTQASTPPNSKVKVQPTGPSMNLAFVQPQAVRAANENVEAPRGAPQQTQTQRMLNHRQVPQQQVSAAQSATPYMQVQPQVPQMYCMPYYGGTQRPMVQQIFSGQYAFTYPPTQPTPQCQWSPFNQLGKKVYDRDFLLALKDAPKSKEKPNNLPVIIMKEDRDLNYRPFIPQAPSIVSTPQKLPPSQTMASNISHSTLKKRRAKAIPIIEPVSGVDKLSEVYDVVESHLPSSHSSSDESSAHEIPKPSYIPKKDIQSAFSKNVNKVINQDKREGIDHFPVHVVNQHLDTNPLPSVFQTLYTAVGTNTGRNDCKQFTKVQFPEKKCAPLKVTINMPKYVTIKKGNHYEFTTKEKEQEKVTQSVFYKDGQWSPFNQLGKKVYDRDFLLALKDAPKSKEKPNNLPVIIMKEDRGQWSPINRQGKKVYDRDFLLGLGNYPKSKQKPNHLPDIITKEGRGYTKTI